LIDGGSVLGVSSSLLIEEQLSNIPLNNMMSVNFIFLHNVKATHPQLGASFDEVG
jgi:hypothetical protein